MSTMAGMSTRFKAVDRETPYLMPPSVQSWLPEQHLARFVVEVVSKLGLHELKMPYTGVGSEAFNLEILLLAKTMGFLKLGKISLDGSKVQANASKHSAMSWGHAVELEQQLKEEVARLMAMAEAADAKVPEGMDIPEELKLREVRLKAIAEAKAKLEQRAA